MSGVLFNVITKLLSIEILKLSHGPHEVTINYCIGFRRV